MELRNCLYQAHPDDNVGIVLINPAHHQSFLEAGESVPIITADGTVTEIITLQTNIPEYFKVSLKDIRDGEKIKKHGFVIGYAVSQIYHAGKTDRSEYFQKLTISKGYPIHITNFIPSEKIFKFWGNFAMPFNTIIEQRETPFEFYSAKHNIAANKEIFLSDLKIENENLKEKLLPTDLILTETRILIGYSKSNIAGNEKIRLGNIIGHGYLFKGREENIKAIGKTYRFIKGRIYEPSW